MHRLLVMGVPIVKSFKICRMKGTCATEYMMHICTKTFDFVMVYNKIQTLKLLRCQWKETPFIRPSKVIRITIGYQFDFNILHTKLEFSTF